MSILVNDYLYTKDLRPSTPAWFRMERCDYCDQIEKNTLPAKRNIFNYLTGKKRDK